MDASVELQEETSLRRTGVVLSILAGLGVLCGLWHMGGTVYWLAWRGGSLGDMILHYRVQPGMNATFTVFVLACVAALLRGGWWVHLVRCSAVWVLGWMTLDVMQVVGQLLAVFVYPNRSGLPAGTCLAVLGCAVYLAGMVAAAGVLEVRSRPVNAPPRVAPRTDWFFGPGVIVVLLGLTARALNFEPVGTHMTIIGTALILLGQCLLRRRFWATSAMAMSVIVLIDLPVTYPLAGKSWAFWVPSLFLAGIGGHLTRPPARVHLAAIILPLVLAAVASVSPKMTVPRTDATYGPGPDRPAGFPSFLQGAGEIVEVGYHVPGLMGEKSVWFKIKDAYPPKEIYDVIAARLEKAGFRTLDVDLTGKKLKCPVPQRWPEQPPVSNTKNWKSHWVNKRHERVMVTVSYCANVGRAKVRLLHVMMEFWRPIGWYAYLLDELKQTGKIE